MQLSPRTLIFIVLLMALPLASYYLMFSPLNNEKLKAEVETREKLDKLSALSKAEAESPNLQTEIDKLQKAIVFFENKLPKEKEMDTVLHEIWQQAEKNGLNVKSVRNMSVKNGQNYSEQPIRMVIIGPATGFYKFLRSVEQLPRITRIGEMTIEGDPKGDGTIITDMVLTIFFEKAETKLQT